MTHSRRPWPAIVYGLALLVITTLPYLMALGQQNEGWHFSGFLFGAEDGQSYIAKMRMGALGELAFTLPYTSEPQDAVPLVNLPYLLPGRLIRQFVAENDPALTGALIGGFHLMRLAGAAIYLLVLYRFISAFVLTPGLRLTAFVLATIGGGLGWLLALTGGALPPEFYIPEGFGFIMLWGLPHLLLARAALLGGLLLVFRAAERNRAWEWSVAAALCWALMGMIVPFYLAVVYAVLAAWIGIAWLRARAFPKRLTASLALGAGLTLPLFAYYFIQFSANPAMAAWSAQNRLPSPPPLDYLLAYLPLLIPAVSALPFVWASAWDKGRLTLLLGWVLVAPLLAYFPISVQRRLLEGVIVPLSILAAIGLAGWARHGRAGRFAAGGMIALSSLSVIVLLLGSLASIANPATPLFRPAAETAALDWLNAHAAPDAVALSSFDTGNVLPAFTHLRPFAGHGPETIAAEEKTRLIEAFYRGEMNADEQVALLAGPCLRPETLPCSDPISYVLFGPIEQALSGSETPGAWANGLTLIYDESGYWIFLVNADRSPETDQGA